MKKAILLSAFILAFSYCSSQTFEIQGGVSLSTVLPNTLNLEFGEAYYMNPGFNIGLSVSFPISRIFSIKTGLLWDTKGFRKEGYQLIKEANTFELFSENITSRIYYLDIPVLLKESYILNDKSLIFTELGPYIGVGLMGKIEFNYEAVNSDRTINRENNVTWGTGSTASNETLIRRLDYGLSFGLGYQLYELQIALAYDLGLANILGDVNSNRTFKNRTFRASLVYVLNGNSRKKYIKQQIELAPSK